MSKPNLPPPSFYQKHEDVCGTEVGPPTPFWNQAAVEEAVRQALAAQVPVAWAIFSPSGNIRYWHHDKANVEAFAAKHGLTVCGLANAGPTSKDAEQIADLVLGHAEGLRVASLLESGTGFGKDVEHRFQVSNGEDRYGVVIILTKLAPLRNGSLSIVPETRDG
jgi:hypothetical protein